MVNVPEVVSAGLAALLPLASAASSTTSPHENGQGRKQVRLIRRLIGLAHRRKQLLHLKPPKERWVGGRRSMKLSPSPMPPGGTSKFPRNCRQTGSPSSPGRAVGAITNVHAVGLDRRSATRGISTRDDGRHVDSPSLMTMCVPWSARGPESLPSIFMLSIDDTGRELDRVAGIDRVDGVLTRGESGACGRRIRSAALARAWPDITGCGGRRRRRRALSRRLQAIQPAPQLLPGPPRLEMLFIVCERRRRVEIVAGSHSRSPNLLLAHNHGESRLSTD